MEWVCEWHSDEAAQIVYDEIQIAGLYAEKVSVGFCPKCHCVTFHALIEVKENEHETD